MTLIDEVEAALSSPDNRVRETAGWALHTLDVARFEHHAPILQNDPNPQVARLAASLMN
jgi:hypothetical protein